MQNKVKAIMEKIISALSWLRSYYLYFYFTCSKEHGKEKLNPVKGFLGTFGILMIFPACLIFFGTAKMFPFIDDSMRETLFYFRGEVNQMILMLCLVDLALTYFVCSFRIRFEEIAPRLQKIPFFAERSVPKCLLFMLANFIVTIVGLSLI